MERLKILFDEVFRDERWVLRTALPPEECAARVERLLTNRRVGSLLAKRDAAARVPGATARPATFPAVFRSPIRFGVTLVSWPPDVDGFCRDSAFSLRARSGGYPEVIGRIERAGTGTDLDVRVPGPGEGETIISVAALVFFAGWLLSLASFAASIGDGMN